MAEAVRVVVRCRPMAKYEKEKGSVKVLHFDKDLEQVTIKKAGN